MPPRHTWSELLQTYWPIFVASLVVSAVATPICRWIAVTRDIVDRPDQSLKPHTRPIPYLGGCAILLGWMGGIAFATYRFGFSGAADRSAGGPGMSLSLVAGIVLSGMLIALLGLWDDVRVLRPRAKIIGICAAALLLMAFGIGHDLVISLFNSIGVRSLELPRGWVIVYSAPLTMIVLLAACNATNLIDGLDGLCSGVLAIISAGFLVLALNIHLYGDWDPLNVHRVVLSLAMMGAAVGFLPYNRSPAKIFLGDAGSMLLGLNAAILLLLFAGSRGMRWMLGATMVFGLPLADMVLTLVRRWRNQRPLMQGDRSHFYDQLVDRGWPVRRVVRISYALAALFAALGCLAVFTRLRYLIFVYALVVVAVIVVVAKMGMLRVDRPVDKGAG